MFTGLIEEIGTIIDIDRTADVFTIAVSAGGIDIKEIVVGESIALDGVCLTVSKTARDVFFAVVGEETQKRTTFGDLREGQRVNLERALRLGDRLGGHMVQGHVDDIGTIASVREYATNAEITVRTSSGWLVNVVEKGAVAVDGISLTVNRVDDSEFGVALIPHTVQNTTLASKRVGDSVNLEADMIGKHVRRLLQAYTDQQQ